MLPNRTNFSKKAGRWVAQHPIWASFLVLFFLICLRGVFYKVPEVAQQPDTKAQPVQAVQNSADAQKSEEEGGTSLESRLTPGDKFALNLEHTFKDNGYDVDARIDIDKSLVLTSDMFREASAREAESTELWKDRNTLCGLDIWYTKVGYSKGIFSDDVTKTVSLECAAQKTARAQEMAVERQKTALDLSVERMHVTASGTVMIFDSDFFSEPTLRSQFVQKMVNDPADMQKWCYLAVSQIQLKHGGQLVGTVPIKCK